jgi:vitamin B12 transporter
MKHSPKRVQGLAHALSLLSLCAAAQQAHGLDINPVVVTASRVEQPLSQALSSVSVITRQEIEKSQAFTLADLLQGEAGFEFGRNGGPGATTSFFLRGQNSINLVVLVDGVRSQVDSIGALQVLDVPLPQIERIEILRGNASALYGDAALGGVISITTRSGKGQAMPYGAIGYGARNTLQTSVGYGGQVGDLRFDMNLGHQHTDGFSAIDTRQIAGANPDRDGYSGEHWSGKLEQRWGADTTLGLRLTGSRSTADTDSAWALSPRDVQQFKKRNNILALSWRQALTRDWTSTLDLSTSDMLYEDFSNGQRLGFYGQFEGRQDAVHWVNTWNLPHASVFQFGAQSTVDRFKVDQGAVYDIRREGQGYFAGLTRTWAPLSLQINARHDEVKMDYAQPGTAAISQQTGADTGLLGLGYALDAHWSLNGSVSSGFRAPTASEVSKNAGLAPESHHSAELGATYTSERLLLRLVHFESQTRNAIVFKPLAGWDYTYDSVGRLDNRGLEATVRAQWQGYALKASAVSQEPWNAVTQKALDRRAKQYGSVDVSRPMGAYELGVKLYAAGARTDGTRTLGGYSLWSLYASRKLDENWTARVRLDNVFDKPYQLAYGYNTPGRGLYATLQYSPR